MTTRELLRHRGLLAVLARDVVSITGSQMTWVAIPWFVLTTTGSPARMTIVLAVEAAALGIVGFLSGNVVSRLGPRRTMLIADGARGPLVALIPILHYVDALSFPLLLVLVAAIGAFATPAIASKQSLMPELVGEDERTLTEANALLQGANRLTLILGPPLGGALIGIVGATSVLLIDAATFVFAFVVILVFVRVGGGVADDEASRGLTAGARFVARDRLLGPWAATVVISDAIWLALFGVMPVLVLERFGERPNVLGAIWGAWGAGAVVGSAATFRLIARIDRLLVGSLGEIGMTAPLWLLLLELPAPAVVATMFVSGLANGIVNAPIHTIISLRTPRALRPKVWAVIIVGSSLLGPPVLVATGPALERAGLVQTLVALLVVQSIAVAAFTAAGLRERTRIMTTSTEPA